MAINQQSGEAVANPMIQPVKRADRGEEEFEAQVESAGLSDGIGFCLSGGGFRAMLFHVGAVLRLNELGLLHQLQRVAGVSGGAITAGLLGANWGKLGFQSQTDGRVFATNLDSQFVAPLRALAKETVDVWSGLTGILNPFAIIADEVTAAYDRVLFQGRTLQALPLDWNSTELGVKGPRFILTATNVKTGTLWRFSRPYMADWRIGKINGPTVPLAVAVAASSAFPPFLSPMTLNLDDMTFEPGIPADEPLRSLRSNATLTDGGVYDNLGLESIWKRCKTVFVSDGGRRMDDDLSPATDWARHSRRLIDLLQNEVSNLRRRQLIDSFTSGARGGAYWGIQTDINRFNLADALVNNVHEATLRIANIPTRLAALTDQTQELLINWGYAICDAATRTHVKPLPNIVPAWPFPQNEITAAIAPN